MLHISGERPRRDCVIHITAKISTMRHYRSEPCTPIRWLGRKELDHAAEDSWRRCDCSICRLNGRRAPGLEQKHDYRSCDWPCIHSCIRRRRGLGCANAFRIRTLIFVAELSGRLMLKNAFAGHEKRPTENALSSALGNADALWKGLVADLKRDLKLDSEEWNSYSIKAGWSLRLQWKKRNIVYLSPSTGCFLASFALGDKAVAAAGALHWRPSLWVPSVAS